MRIFMKSPRTLQPCGAELCGWPAPPCCRTTERESSARLRLASPTVCRPWKLFETIKTLNYTKLHDSHHMHLGFDPTIRQVAALENLPCRHMTHQPANAAVCDTYVSVCKRLHDFLSLRILFLVFLWIILICMYVFESFFLCFLNLISVFFCCVSFFF